MVRLCSPLGFLLAAFASAENAQSDSTFQNVEQPTANLAATFTSGTVFAVDTTNKLLHFNAAAPGRIDGSTRERA